MTEALLQSPASYVAVAFLFFFVGFAVGRRQGKREGFAEGVRYAPLEMRRQTWESGRCVICGSEASDSVGAKRTPGDGKESS